MQGFGEERNKKEKERSEEEQEEEDQKEGSEREKRNLEWICEKLKRHKTNHNMYENDFEKASVLIPLSQDQNGQVFVWFTTRSMNLRTSPGETAFPGGKQDSTDSGPLECCLRECEEEIGLTREEIKVINRLDPLINKSGVLVTPFVGVISDSFIPKPNPQEVSKVFKVPLLFFVNPKEELEHSGKEWEIEGITRLTHFFYYGPHDVIWGLTAMFVLHVIEICDQQWAKYPIHHPKSTSWFQRTLTEKPKIKAKI